MHVDLARGHLFMEGALHVADQGVEGVRGAHLLDANLQQQQEMG